MDEEIAKFSTSDVKNYKRLLQASKKIFDVLFEISSCPISYSLVNDEANPSLD